MFFNKGQHKDFSASHPLFIRLFETAIQWSSHKNEFDDNNASISNPLYSEAEELFTKAAADLLEDLRLTQLSDLGYLYDSVISTNMIAKKNMFAHSLKSKAVIRRSSSTASWLLTSITTKGSTDETVQQSNQTKRERLSSTSALDHATVIDVFNDTNNNEIVKTGLTVHDSKFEDKHIFLVKKIDSDKDLVSLLSIGFRFAEPVFIAKTMGDKLKVSSDYMLNHFQDMLQMANTVTKIYNPIRSSSSHFFANKNHKNEEVRGGIFVGLFVLVEDESLPKDVPYIIVDKEKRNTFPLVQLNLDSEPTGLTKDQKNVILALSGQSLSSISNICSSNSFPNSETTSVLNDGIELENGLSKATFVSSTESNLNQNNLLSIEYTSSPKEQMRHFIQALEKAAKGLISISSYGKPIASSAKLHSDVIDIPAFSLRAGPCQLILFRAHITTPGTRFAINQTYTETIKCVPFPLYRSFAFASTNAAVAKYRQEQNKNKAPSSYLTQQRLYQSTALHRNEQQERESQSLTVYTSSATSKEHAISSLPPPPRAKRNKFNLPTGIDISSISKEFIPNVIKGTKSIPLSPTVTELPIILNVLPVNGRFWWLHSIYEEIHNNM